MALNSIKSNISEIFGVEESSQRSREAVAEEKEEEEEEEDGRFGTRPTSCLVIRLNGLETNREKERRENVQASLTRREERSETNPIFHSSALISRQSCGNSPCPSRPAWETLASFLLFRGIFSIL